MVYQYSISNHSINHYEYNITQHSKNIIKYHSSNMFICCISR